jgi:outer membrane protein TolC
MTSFRNRLRTAAVASVVVVGIGCSSLGPRGLTEDAPLPEAPERPARIDPPTPPAAAAAELPEQLLQPDSTFTLADVVDIALRHNPSTRAAYLEAIAAAEKLEADRSAYYPRIDLSADVTRTQQSALGGQFDFLQTSYGPAVDLSWLVLDLGGRAADVEDARLAVLTADWSHTAVVQDVILAVQQTYVEYLNAKAQLVAARVSVDEAETALTAATVRHDAGVATIAEVLQARTARSQAQLAVDQLTGRVMALRGALATAMGLPANLPYDVGELPPDLPLEATTRSVESLIEQARSLRPDLAAARTEAERAAVHIRSVRADGQPSLVASATAGREYYHPSTFADSADSWSARLLLRIPVFTGFEVKHNVARAEAQAEAAAARAESIEQQVILQVWTSYYGLETATQLVRTTTDLLASAEQSERVALGRYREGVGTIIDLLAAQAALADARAQHITARASWFYALAQLARDTGTASPTLQAAVGVTSEPRTP